MGLYRDNGKENGNYYMDPKPSQYFPPTQYSAHPAWRRFKVVLALLKVVFQDLPGLKACLGGGFIVRGSFFRERIMRHSGPSNKAGVEFRIRMELEPLYTELTLRTLSS